jgi:hypothetical protein
MGRKSNTHSDRDPGKPISQRIGKFERVGWTSDYWEDFFGYREAYVVNVNGKTRYILHRYFEIHCPLCYIVSNGSWMNPNSGMTSQFNNNTDVEDLGQEATLNQRYGKYLNNVVGRHEYALLPSKDALERKFSEREPDVKWRHCLRTPFIRKISGLDYFFSKGDFYDREFIPPKLNSKPRVFLF